ncbi:Glycosyltransferase involved in cell wall bisynthesis [Prevotella sp. ne3005]|uniref:glycosyltransferase family 2 protein n=1 Tax=Prevotella sp. ne3005 TaxID=1761887 RepID=UPI0008B37751|nr:glycosyltransferase [Prevotella sp. ne3005]SEM53765.1 Glycosyltransferase involved in cell wall bisynthesis [Prevotella sp. ne3005]
MENNPKISVVMPVYNTGEYLNKAIDSILNQNFQDYELILVDDGSEDGSSELCDKYANADNRIVVIHQKNGGICNARNAALKIAKGDYIAFSDHDDEYLPGLLEESYRRAINDDADIVKFGKKEYIISDGVVVRTRQTSIYDMVLKDSLIADNYLQLLNKNIIDCVWDSLIKKDLIIQNNVFFDESYKAGGEDIDFITRIFKYAKVVSLMRKTFYLHYIREGFSTSSKFNPIKLSTLKLLAERITEGAKALGVDLYEKRKEYVYQMTYTLLNAPATLLTKKGCKMTKKEKYSYLDDLRESLFLPEWFFKQSPLLIVGLSKRYAMSYFLFKHKLYTPFFLITNMRSLELTIKKKIIRK